MRSFDPVSSHWRATTKVNAAPLQKEIDGELAAQHGFWSLDAALDPH